MQKRGVGLGCRLEVDDRRQRPVGHCDTLGRVLRGIAVAGQRNGDGLADIAHLFDREAPVLHLRPERDRKRLCPAARIFACHHTLDGRDCQGSTRIDRQDFGVSVRGAKDYGMQSAGPRRQIVGETAMAAK